MKRDGTARAPRNVPSDRLAQLRTFLDIVETGSLSAAAERSATTQPTVSRRLQALEAHLGVRLLRRTTHAVGLTPDGERCHARALELLRGWDAFEEDLRGTSADPEGPLRVVVPHAFGQEKLVGPLAAFLRRHPKVRVEWMLRDPLPDFVAEGVDCAIHLGEVREPGLVAVRLVEVRRVVVASPALMGGVVPRRPEDLERLPWLSLRGYYRDGIELRNTSSGHRRAISFRTCMSTDNLYALQNAAIEGLGACAASSWLMGETVRSGALERLLPGWEAAPMPVHLVYPWARHQPSRLRRFVETMRELVPRALDQESPPPARPGARRRPVA